MSENLLKKIAFDYHKICILKFWQIGLFESEVKCQVCEIITPYSKQRHVGNTMSILHSQLTKITQKQLSRWFLECGFYIACIIQSLHMSRFDLFALAAASPPV